MLIHVAVAICLAQCPAEFDQAINSPGGLSGTSVAMDGNLAVVGSPLATGTEWASGMVLVYRLVDEVWTVSAPVEMIVDRLKSRNGLSSDEARQRITSQMSTEERLKRSDVEVDNSGDVSALGSAVKILWEDRIKAKVGKV